MITEEAIRRSSLPDFEWMKRHFRQFARGVSDEAVEKRRTCGCLCRALPTVLRPAPAERHGSRACIKKLQKSQEV